MLRDNIFASFENLKGCRYSEDSLECSVVFPSIKMGSEHE